MLGARWHKVLFDLWGNKMRTVLIVISIAVGLIAIGVIGSAQMVLAEKMQSSYAAVRPSSGTIRILETFDEDFVRSVRRMDGVADADARRNLMLRFRPEQGTESVCRGDDCTERLRDLQLFAVSDYEDMHLNKVEWVSGTWPPPEQGVVIERSAMDLLGANIGDTIVVETTDRRQKQLRVVGTARDMAMVPSALEGMVRGYIAWETLDYLGEERGFNELHVLVSGAGGKGFVRTVVNQVKDRVEDVGYTIPYSLSSEPGQVPLDDILQSILLLLAVLGFMSLFLSVFLIVNTTSALVSQQSRLIGIMKSVGGQSTQIVAMYLSLVAAYGAMALALAIPIGMIGAHTFSVFMADFFNFDLSVFQVPLQAVALQVFVGVFVPILAALPPVLSTARLTAAEVVSSQGISAGDFGSSILDRWLTRGLSNGRILLPRSLTVSLRNTFRRKGRLLLTLVTLTLGGVIFISVFSVRASMAQTMGEIGGMYHSDLWVNFAYPQRIERVERQAAEVPGVEAAAAWARMPVRRVRPDGSEGDNLLLLAPPMASEWITPKVLEGRWLRAEDRRALVFSTGAFKVEPDVKVGDELMLKVDGRDTPFEVVGVSLGFGLAPFVYASYEDVAEITRNVGHTGALMVVMGNKDADALTDAAVNLETYFRAKGTRISSIQLVRDETAPMEMGFSLIILLSILMAGLLAVVGGLGLMGTVGINVLERTREIGVMRAIGAGDAAVAQVFVLESVFIGVISWSMGALLAVPVSGLMSRALGMALLQSPFSYRFSLVGVAIWLLVVIVLSVVASFLPARSASRLTVREVLAYE
jgi:putative ABC transport system permease protein